MPKGKQIFNYITREGSELNHKFNPNEFPKEELKVIIDKEFKMTELPEAMAYAEGDHLGLGKNKNDSIIGKIAIKNDLHFEGEEYFKWKEDFA